MMKAPWFAVLALGCTHPGPVTSAPPLVLGEFEDDYASRYSISEREWVHGSQARYHIVSWRPQQQHLIARSDAGNPTDPDAAAAESTGVARRETPRTGCNGFPFSRMKRRFP